MPQKANKQALARTAVCDHARAAVSALKYGIAIGDQDDNPDFSREYLTALRAARDAALKAIDEVQIVMLNAEGRSPRTKGLQELTCEACGRTFRSGNPKKRTCHDHTLKDIGNVEWVGD